MEMLTRVVAIMNVLEPAHKDVLIHVTHAMDLEKVLELPVMAGAMVVANLVVIIHAKVVPEIIKARLGHARIVRVPQMVQVRLHHQAPVQHVALVVIHVQLIADQVVHRAQRIVQVVVVPVVIIVLAAVKIIVHGHVVDFAKDVPVALVVRVSAMEHVRPVPDALAVLILVMVVRDAQVAVPRTA